MEIDHFETDCRSRRGINESRMIVSNGGLMLCIEISDEMTG